MKLGIRNIGWCSLLLTSASLSIWQGTSGQTFTDVSIDQGIFPEYNSPDNWGSGVSFYDIDQDGWDDLTYTRASDSIHFYLNNQGVFERVHFNIPAQPKIKQALWIDYDNDGDNDLMVSNYFGNLHLYQNDGDNNFVDVIELSGLPQSTGYYYGISFADYNKDGDLDLYIAKYHFYQDDFIHKNELYKNNGDGTFSNATIEAGLLEVEATTFQGGWFDYNHDGWPDLYEINDRTNFDNLLYHNNGDGTFTCVSEETNTQFSGNNPMTFTAGDYDNDGDIDLYITNTGGNVLHTELLTNNGNGQFLESAQELGALSELFSWGALWVDYNNNGVQDLYMATSPINLMHPVYKDQFFIQSESGFFEPDTTVFQGMQVQRNYAVVRGDINNDGFSDIATHSISPYPANLWLNSGGDNNYIKITPHGTVSNRMAIGSWIKVFMGDEQYTKYTMCGENYVSQNSQHLIFGIGGNEVIDSVKVQYLSGHTDRYFDLVANQHYDFFEGETYQPEIISDQLAVCEGDTVWLDAGVHTAYLWSNGHQERYLSVTESGAYTVTTWNEYGIAGQSDTVSIEFAPTPIILPAILNPLCFGDSTGFISLSNLTQVPLTEVIWDNGLIGTEIDSLAAGNYSYSVVDENACTDTGSVFLQYPFALSALIFSYPETEGNDGSISLIINGGVSPYDIYLNDELQQQNEITGLSAGVYSLLIIDANGCSFSEDILVDNVTTTKEMMLSEMRIFPNPLKSGNQLNLQNLSGSYEFDVILSDASGRIFWKSHLGQIQSDIQELNIPPVEPGVYFLRIVSNEETFLTTELMIIK